MYEPYENESPLFRTDRVQTTGDVEPYKMPSQAQSFMLNNPTVDPLRMRDNVNQVIPRQEEVAARPKPVGIAQFAGSQQQPVQAPQQPSNGFRPSHVILHDYGKLPKNQGDGMFNPYNALVMPDGSVRYRNPSNPYGERAPHAAGMNPYSVGLSYGGPVGEQPTSEGLASLQREYGRIRQQYPGIISEGHGQAYKRTEGTPLQASRDGRDLIEASWRSSLNNSSAPNGERQISQIERGNPQLTQAPQPEPRPNTQDTGTANLTPGSADQRISELQTESNSGTSAPAQVSSASQTAENVLYSDAQKKQQQQAKLDERKKQDEQFRFQLIPMLPQHQNASVQFSVPDLSGFGRIDRNPLYG